MLQIGHTGLAVLAGVQILRLRVHYLLRCVCIRQLHRDSEGEAMELEQARRQKLPGDLLHRLDEFEVSLYGSAGDNLLFLDHTNQWHVSPLDQDC